MRHLLSIFFLSLALAGVQAQTNQALFPGDSLTLYPDPTNNFPYYLSRNPPPGNNGLTNLAVAGQTINQRLSDLASAGGFYVNVDATCQNIVVSWYCGHNDFKNGSNAVQVIRDHSNFVATVNGHFPTIHFRWLYYTIPVGSDITGQAETERQSFNAYLRTNHVGAYALIDLAANPILSDYITYPSYWLGDRIHLTGLGNTVVTNLVYVPYAMALTNNGTPTPSLNASTCRMGTVHLP